MIGDADAVGGSDLGLKISDLLGVAEPVQRDVGSGSGERPGDAKADPAGRTGDEGGPTGKRAGRAPGTGRHVGNAVHLVLRR